MESGGPITINVGGTKFTTSATTLINHSSYINWKDDSDEIFVDQDPVPFAVLLAYMRRGNIKVDDIDTDVLTLAEFLGLEQFLLAVKIRWYYNVGRGPVCSTDEEIATAFEQVHGGIRGAISEGLFPFFLKQDDIDAERDLATVFVEFGAALGGVDSVRFSVTECINGEIQKKRSCDSLVGALNGIFAKDYTSHEDLDRQNGYINEATFSRRAHRAEQNTSSTTRIFIPTDNDERKRHYGRRKQLAMYLLENSQVRYELITPSQILKDDPSATTNIIEGHGTHLYLQKHKFITQELGLDEIFVTYFNLLKRKYTDCRIYSRMI